MRCNAKSPHTATQCAPRCPQRHLARTANFGLCHPCTDLFCGDLRCTLLGRCPKPRCYGLLSANASLTASASGCSRQFVLLRRARIQSVPPSLLPRAVVSPSKQCVAGGNAPPLLLTHPASKRQGVRVSAKKKSSKLLDFFLSGKRDSSPRLRRGQISRMLIPPLPAGSCPNGAMESLARASSSYKAKRQPLWLSFAL